MAAEPEDNRPVDAAQRAVAIASHDIRGSLAAIVAHAELIVEGELAPERREEITRLIARNGRSLLSLLDDVLFASRIEAGAERAESLPCSPRRLLEDLVELHGPDAEARGLCLELDLALDLPATLLVDETHLRRILGNLVGNAIKFTERGGVRIHARHDDGTLVVGIEDTGIGLAPQEIREVFDPFVRSRTADRPGSGLGLAIVRELTDLLEGTIDVHSEPDVGSTFTVAIPARAVPTTLAPTRLDGIRVFAAEDCPDGRRLLQYRLRRLGAVPTLFASGDALQDHWSACAAGDRPDVILLDLEMPSGDGLQTASALRSLGCGAPIVLLTAHAGSDVRATARRSGCDACLSKPFEPARFAERLAVLRSDARLPEAG